MFYLIGGLVLCLLFNKRHVIVDTINNFNEYRLIKYKSMLNTIIDLAALQYQSTISRLYNTYFRIEMGKPYSNVVYYYKSQKYKIPILLNKKNSIQQIITSVNTDNTNNGDSRDITFDIISYLGPNYDCHGLLITPSMLGYSNITIILKDGTTMRFEPNSNIII